MKIKTLSRTYDQVMALPQKPHRKPRRRSLFWHTLARIIIIPDMLATHFKVRRNRRAEPGEPCLILMNHSCFLDLKLAIRLFYPRPFGIVATTDAMIGKESLMRWLGCIPTQKFVTDMSLIRDIRYMLKEKKSSVLMYPEAGYSFDGTATTLPQNLGSLFKMLDVPVMTVITYGAFARDPLYNGLQIRKTRVEAEVKCLFTREQVGNLSIDELNAGVREAFSFDQFAWQHENSIRIDEPFRADGLHRILYKCPACGAEGEMEGKGIHLTCHACGKIYRLTELGRMEAENGITEYPHIPDWYAWEREAVRAEVKAGTYRMDIPVDVAMLVDTHALYRIGQGRLTHGPQGFCLTEVSDADTNGRVLFEQKPRAAYSLNADFFWYEIGDVVSIGDRRGLFYCFPQPENGKISPVAKARLATEELYRTEMEKGRIGGQ